MRLFQRSHVKTNECVQYGQNVASPGWDGTSTSIQSGDWEWNRWCPRGTKQDQEVVTNIALWKYTPRSSCKTWSIVLSNWNSINKALSCLTMLSCPRCGSGNLKDRKITQHASYLILHGSKHIVLCTTRHIGKEVKVQFIDGWLTLLFSSAMRILHTTTNVTSGLSNSGYKLSKTLLEHLHYFHTWSCLLPSKYKTSFLRIHKNQRCKNPLKHHQRFFLECIVLIIVDEINAKVISIKCIGFIQWCDGWFRVLLFTT